MACDIVGGNYAIAFFQYTLDGLVNPFIYNLFYFEEPATESKAVRNNIIDCQIVNRYPYRRPYQMNECKNRRKTPEYDTNDVKTYWNYIEILSPE